MTDESFEELSPERQRKIRHEGQATSNLAFGYACALMISQRPSQEGKLNHGSGFSVRHGKVYSVITAEHVVRECRERMADEPDVRLHLAAPKGSSQLDPTQRLTFCDSDIDIAVLRITPEEALSTGTWPYAVLEWPPPEPVVEEMVYLAGFPGIGRIQLSQNAHEFRAFTLGTMITSVTLQNFKCVFERDYWISYEDIAPTPPDFLGGVSGGPVLAMRGLRLTLLGAISAHHESLDVLWVSRLNGIPEVALSAS